MKTIAWIAASVAFVTLILFIPLKGHSQVATMTRTWTAPGDDDNVGTASSYEMRFSTSAPDTTSAFTIATWWNAATPVTNMPPPAIAGTPQSVAVHPTGGFKSGLTYYFVMKACDEVPNCSPYSNVRVVFVPDTTPPNRIIDLF